MNKTITANVGGFVFNIEEQAYETLSKYLAKIRASMQHDEAIDEVMQDIEHRVAELFHQLLERDKREVIDSKDITHIIQVMGEPEEYNINDESQKATENENEYSEKGKNRQFFRDPEDQILGGVCSGLSAYFGWDPLFMRILFVILFFGFGTGFLIYLLLWIIVPVASTTAEKMRMRGEKVDVESIKQRFQNVKKDVQDLGSEERRRKIKENSSRLGQLIQDLAHQFYVVFGNIIGILFLILGVAFLIWLTKSAFSNSFIFGITDHGIEEFDLTKYGALIFGTSLKANLVFLSVFILFLVPIISLLLAGFRLIFKRKIKIKALSITIGIFSSLAVTALLFIGVQTGIDFSKQKTQKSYFAIETESDTLIIKANPDPYFSSDFENHHDAYFELMSFNDKKIISGTPTLTIESADDTSFAIVIEKTAHGNSQSNAQKRTENIEYQFNVEQNTAYFNPYFMFNKSDLIRSQNCKIIVKIPEGKVVYLAPGTDRIIYDIQNKVDMSDEDMVGKYWRMNNNLLEQAN